MHVRAAIFAAAFVAATACAAPAQPSAATSAPSPKPTPLSGPYLGTYVLSRAGAEATQHLTLRLRPDRIATLRTETPGVTQTAAGTPLHATYETGQWYEKDGHAYVHFDTSSTINDRVPTEQRKESVDLTFTLSGCTLKLTSDPKNLYGSNGLAFAKQQCTP